MSPLQTPPPPPPYKSPTTQLNEPHQTMAKPLPWASSDDDDDDEALSLSDLPLKSLPGEVAEKERKSPQVMEDFEFHGLLSKDMCAADDVFFQGQILPLRQMSVGSSRCPSRSESRSNSSLGFDSIRSLSSSSNSSSRGGTACVSRSSSHSSNCDVPPRASVSNNFYAHPSPSPRVRRASRANSSGRKSTGSAPPGWGDLLRLGVVKAPEIELRDLRPRRPRAAGSESKCETKVINKSGPRFGFGCRCKSDAVEPVVMKSREVTSKKEKEVGSGLERGGSMCRRSRMFEWLEELSIGKELVG